MIKLIDLLRESLSFTNWKIPDTTQLKLEYKIEHELKEKDFFKDEKDFLQAVKKGTVISVAPALDAKIGNRSRTSSYEDLLDLIKQYRSYPAYRNEKTLKSLYTGFKENKPMDMPIIVEFKDGYKTIFSGNTRMDIAFQLGITPKALLIHSTQD